MSEAEAQETQVIEQERTPRQPPRPGPPTETRPFLLSSEFVATALLIAGLAIAAATTDGVDAPLFWGLTTVAAALYVVSRGFAKARTGSRSYDPREALFDRIGARRRNG
jgi:hypothetical protein